MGGLLDDQADADGSDEDAGIQAREESGLTSFRSVRSRPARGRWASHGLGVPQRPLP